MPSFVMIFFKTLISYIFVLVLTRLMGRKLISQMTFFNFVVGVTLGTLMASLILGTKYSTMDVATVLLTLTALAILTGFLTLKSPSLRKAVDSGPTPLVSNGKIVPENLTKTRMTLSHLQMLLREKNAFNIADVEFALMEPDGKLSVLLKSQKQPLTPSDLNIATSYKGVTADLIVDGRIQHENLKNINLNEAWLTDTLQTKGINKPNDVFYAGLDTSGNLYVSVKNREWDENDPVNLV